MAFVMIPCIDIAWVPDGASAMEVPSGPKLRFFGSQSNPAGETAGGVGFAGGALIPGGNAPTLANYVTALANLSTDIQAQLTPAVIARINGLATGANG